MPIVISRKSALLMTGLAVGAAALASPAQAETIGRIADVKMGAYATAPEGSRAPAYAHDSVVRDVTLETVRRGALAVRFNDRSELTMGSDARLTIDRMVYDPSGVEGDEPAIRLLAGAFRMVSNSASGTPQPITVPHGVIGIRGTTWTAVVDPEAGTTTVKTVTGLIAVTSTVTNETVDVPAGFSLSISEGGVGDVAAMGPMDVGFTGDEAVDSVARGGGLDTGPSALGGSADSGSSGGDH